MLGKTVESLDDYLFERYLFPELAPTSVPSEQEALASVPSEQETPAGVGHEQQAPASEDEPSRLLRLLRRVPSR